MRKGKTRTERGLRDRRNDVKATSAHAHLNVTGWLVQVR